MSTNLQNAKIKDSLWLLKESEIGYEEWNCILWKEK